MSRYITIIYMVFMGIAGACILQACNSTGTTVSPSSANTKMLIVNTSPDVNPIKIYINNIQLGTYTTSFRYPGASSYYGINAGAQQINVDTDHGNLILSVTPNTPIQSGLSYSLFLVGLKSDSTLSAILTVDTSATAKIGSGKIRFVNASPRSPALDMSANGTPAFRSVNFKGVTPYVELPAGVYDFKVTPTGNATTILTDVPRVTIQDGRLYTLFARGIVNRTDTAAFGAAIITNK